MSDPSQADHEDTAPLLDDMWQRQQIKTFTAWANSHLRKRDLKIENLSTDLGDGKLLLNLMEIVGDSVLPKPAKHSMRAMDAIGFSKETQDEIWKCVATVLHLGNVEFEAVGEHCKITSTNVTQQIASLLGGSAQDVEKSLTNRVVAARGQVVESQLRKEQGMNARDALAKALYDRVFTYIVRQINTAIEVRQEGNGKCTVIGVLDIYGFEIFETNSFEQLCINYCNEKLQQLFIELVLKREQEEYRNEGIVWRDVEFFNNQIICDLVEAPRTGILAVLDEKCIMVGNITDKDFLLQLDRVCGKHAHYASRQTNRDDKQLVHNEDFRLKHFAGDVIYHVDNFIEKNKDTLFQDLKRLLYNSNLKLLKEMFPEGAKSIKEVTKRPITAGKSFKTSMHALVQQLQAKEPFYVRCIKPNESKSSSKFENERVTHQIRYLGLMENVRVRRAGYANRQTQEHFLARYKLCSPATWPHHKGSVTDGVRALLKHFKLSEAQNSPDNHDVALGKTKIFISKPATLAMLERARHDHIPPLVVKIQARWRAWLARRYFRRVRAVFIIKRVYKHYKLRKFFFRIFRTFKDVEHDPHLGRDKRWPKPPKVLRPFVRNLQRIHKNWRASKMVSRLTKDEQAEMRMKIIAYTVLRGKKQNWGYNRRWEGDYLHKDTYNPDMAGYRLGVEKVRRTSPFKKILFSSYAIKWSSKNKCQRRAIVLTDTCIMKLDPTKHFKLATQPFSLDRLSGVSVYSGDVPTCVIHVDGDNDVVICFEIKKVVSEFMAVLLHNSFKFNKKRAKVLKVNVLKDLTFEHRSKKILHVRSTGDVEEPRFVKTMDGCQLEYPVSH